MELKTENNDYISLNNDYIKQAEHAMLVNTDFIKQSIFLSEMFSAGLIEPDEYHEQMMVISDKAWEEM